MNVSASISNSILKKNFHFFSHSKIAGKSLSWTLVSSPTLAMASMSSMTEERKPKPRKFGSAEQRPSLKSEKKPFTSMESVSMEGQKARLMNEDGNLLKNITPNMGNHEIDIPPEDSFKDDIGSISTSDLMRASLHLGHSKSSWCPTMLPFIYGTRHGLHIINLSETMACLKRSRAFIYEVARKGGNVLFVGTRPMLHHLVVKTASENHAFFCTHWIGGTITNKERVLRRSVGYDPDKVSQSLKAQSSSNPMASDQEAEETNSISELERKKQPIVATPDVLVLFDYPNTKWAVREANLAHIPVVAVCDTDCDPSLVQYPIPASDDSLKGLELIASVLGRACKEGYQQWTRKDSFIQ